MHAFACILATSALVASVTGHAILINPASRAVRLATGFKSGDATDMSGTCIGGMCEWYTQKTTAQGPVTNCDANLRTMGVNCGDSNPADWPCTPEFPTPWCAPGTAKVLSPCGVFSGGWGNNGRDMLDLPMDMSPPVWVAGQNTTITWSIVANHGGGFQYRLCPANGSLTEECFQSNVLEFAGDTQDVVDPSGKVVSVIKAIRTNKGTWPKGSTWTRNPVPTDKGVGAAIPGLPDVYGRGPFRYGLRDTVKVPTDLPTGDYVMSFRWDSEQVQQVWAHCTDIHIANKAMPAPPAASKPAAAVQRTSTKNVCVGASIGLDTYECDIWGEFFDSMNGLNWNPEINISMKTDPCASRSSVNQWNVKVKCESLRDAAHITEIYLLGENITGTIPPSFTGLSRLAALSIVDSNLGGELPAAMGDLSSLKMLWMDHNPKLVGNIPASFERLSLNVIELVGSGFSGKLPQMSFTDIADCVLGGAGKMIFDCPLPPGAETCGAVCK